MRKTVFDLPAGVLGLVLMFLLLGLLATTAPVLAEERELNGHENQALWLQAQPTTDFQAIFKDPALLQVFDLDRNLLGEGVHLGAVKCMGDNCQKKTLLAVGLLPNRVEYQFKTLQALDSEARRAVVAGTGILHSEHGRGKFLFTATFEDNRDGTMAVTYVASRPDASFTIPDVPGTFEITSRP